MHACGLGNFKLRNLLFLNSNKIFLSNFLKHFFFFKYQQQSFLVKDKIIIVISA